MKSLKYILLFLAAAVTFTACEEEWTPGEPDAAQSVYFPSDIRSFTLTTEDTSVEFPVYRAVAGDAVAVNLLTSVVDPTTEAETDLFTLPTSVSFAAGEVESSYTITFDTAQLEAGVKYNVMIQVKDAEFRGNYGISSLSFTIGLPEPWVSLGEGIYRDNFYSCLVNGLDPGYMAYVDIQQHAVEQTRVRAYALFGREMMASFYGGIPDFVEYYAEDMSLEFDMTDPEAIIIKGDADAIFESPAQSVGFIMDGMKLHLVMNDATKLGVYRDGIISFPHANSFYIVDEEYYGLYGNDAGLLAFAFPGSSFVDPSISADYAGMTIDAEGNAKAVVEFKLGFDVTSYKFVVLDADATATVEEVVAGILDGTLEEGVYVSEDASQLKWEVPVKKGVFTVVAVPYIGEDAYDAYDEMFYFPGAEVQIPEFEAEVVVDSIYNITGNAANEEAFPTTSSFGIYMGTEMGDAIKSITYFVGQGALDEKIDDSVYIANGKDASAFIPDIIEKGYAIMVFQDMPAGMECGVLISFDTVFGVKTIRTTYTIPTEAPVIPETPGEGDGTEGDGTEGDGTEGDGTEGDGTEGEGTEGDGTEGDGTEGEGTEGEGTEGEGTEGDATQQSFKASKSSLVRAPRIVKDIVPYYGEVKHEYTARQAQALR